MERKQDARWNRVDFAPGVRLAYAGPAQGLRHYVASVTGINRASRFRPGLRRVPDRRGPRPGLRHLFRGLPATRRLLVQLAAHFPISCRCSFGIKNDAFSAWRCLTLFPLHGASIADIISAAIQVGRARPMEARDCASAFVLRAIALHRAAQSIRRMFPPVTHNPMIETLS